MSAPLLFAAGVLAGIIGSAGGITSLIAYPALITAGLSPFAANTTNSVALLGSGLGAAARSGPEIAGHGRTLRHWLPLFVPLSAGGALLLVGTPGGVFDRVVPFLVLAGSVVVLAQPAIASRRDGRQLAPPGATVGGGAVAVYNGYYGAGSGILAIGLLLLTDEPEVRRANALKNVILCAADLAPAVIFAVTGTVVWSAVWPLGLGALVGGLLGPGLARRVPAAALRVLSAACGFVLAGWLFAR